MPSPFGSSTRKKREDQIEPAGSELLAGLLQRPDFHDAMCNRAWRFRNDLDRLDEIGGVNHREAGDRQGGRHEGGVLRPDSASQGVADLRRRARDTDQGSAFFSSASW